MEKLPGRPQTHDQRRSADFHCDGPKNGVAEGSQRLWGVGRLTGQTAFWELAGSRAIQHLVTKSHSRKLCPFLLNRKFTSRHHTSKASFLIPARPPVTEIFDLVFPIPSTTSKKHGSIHPTVPVSF